MRRPDAILHACGLDFGTSNSTLGTVAGGHPKLVTLEADHVTVPSGVFFGTDADTRFLIGRAAMAAYVDGRGGRLMRALKSILGSSLIDEQTQVYRRRIPFSDVIRLYVGALKERAEKVLGHGLEAVVHGRPVHFVDGDGAADRAAEATLEGIARAVGFRHVSFQFEPIAAALDFERQIDREHLALIADIGGGTSDFTVVRLGPDRRGKADRAGDILATAGVRIGGTDFDRAASMAAFMPLLGFGSPMARGDIDVPSGPYWDLSTWSLVHRLYDKGVHGDLVTTRRMAARPDLIDRLIRVVDQRRAHSMLVAVEAAKVVLSEDESATSDLGWVEAGLQARTSRPGFEAATGALTERIAKAGLDCVRQAGLGTDKVTAVFLTGGTSSIPSVRRAILQGFDRAVVVDGDRFGSVGLGLAIEAGRRYG